jgi:transposase
MWYAALDNRLHLCQASLNGLAAISSGFFRNILMDWIGEEYLVRVVDLFVDQLDLADLGSDRVAHACNV